MNRNVLILATIFILLFGCSNDQDLNSILTKKWEKCQEKSFCEIDFSELMWFQWDVMYYFSAAYSLEEINQDLGFDLKGFTDIGDRLIFMKNGNVVYKKEWFPKASQPAKGIVFLTDSNKLKVVNSDSKFKMSKQGMTFVLQKE